MKSTWKNALDQALINERIEIWPVAMLWQEAQFQPDAPSRPTFDRWLDNAVTSGKLKRIRAGLYLNAMGNQDVSPAAAAGHIRRGAIPSLAWVLEQNWLLNNFGDTITCTLAFTTGEPPPSTAAVVTPLGTFRFHAIPWRIREPAGVPVGAWMDERFAHPRATPEKAFADWLYLANSPHSKLRPPPLDMEFDRLDLGKLRRIVKAMDIDPALATWRDQKIAYDGDPDVEANDYTGIRQRKA